MYRDINLHRICATMNRQTTDRHSRRKEIKAEARKVKQIRNPALRSWKVNFTGPRFTSTCGIREYSSISFWFKPDSKNCPTFLLIGSNMKLFLWKLNPSCSEMIFSSSFVYVNSPFKRRTKSVSDSVFVIMPRLDPSLKRFWTNKGELWSSLLVVMIFVLHENNFSLKHEI